MLVAASVAIALLAVPLLGGRLSALSSLRLRATWAIYAALAAQIVIISLLPGGTPTLHRLVQLATYGLAAWFVLANRAIPGVLLIGAGGGLNLAAMVANGGVMPASKVAVAAAGLRVDNVFMNSRPMAHPRLLALGDVWSVPSWVPLHNVFSIGDVAIVLGGAVLAHAVCGSRLGRRLVRHRAPVPATAPA